MFRNKLFSEGAQTLYTQLMEYLSERSCLEKLSLPLHSAENSVGPVISINGKNIEHCTLEMAVAEIEAVLRLKM